MGERYPIPASAPWFPEKIAVYPVTGRDLFGAVTTADEPILLGAKVKPRVVEMMENGARVQRKGALIRCVRPVSIAIEAGALVRANGVDYQVIAVDANPDHNGIVHFLTLDCVRKGGEAVP